MRLETRRVTEVGIIIGLVVICIVFSVINPRFATSQSVLNILRQVSILTIVSLGGALVISTGGFDLSLGGVMGLTAVLSAGLMVHQGFPSAIAALAAIAIGSLIGISNGILITKLNVSPLLASLGMLFLAEGAEIVYSRGVTIFPPPGDPIFFLGQGNWMGIPTIIFFMIMFLVLTYFILNHLRLGRIFYALGGNREAVKLSGIKPGIYTFIAYVLAGCFYSVGGVLLFSRMGCAIAHGGQGYLLRAFAAMFIATTLAKEGRLNVQGVLVGAIFLGVLTTGLTMANVSYVWQDISMGAALVAAVIVGSLRKEEWTLF